MKLEDLVAHFPSTEPLYWLDSYQRRFSANILKLQPEEKRAVYVILDKTLFHPKSGGQPSDRGFIYGPNFRVEVKKTMLVGGGVIVHWGKIVEEGIGERSLVEGEIDWERRYLLMRRHTAAHLLDHCLTSASGIRVEATDSWLDEPSYVGYKGDVPAQEVLKKAEELESEMIARGGRVEAETIPYQELIRRAPDAPNIYRLPTLNSVRIVTIMGCNPIPCGGTHIRNIKELKGFILKGAEKVESGFRVYFDLL